MKKFDDDLFSKLYEIVGYDQLKKINEKNTVKKNLKKTVPLKFLKKQNIFWSLRLRNFINEMVKKKVSYGQHRSKINSDLQPYLLGFLNGYAVINLNHTLKQLQSALRLLYKVVSQKGNVFLVGTEIIYSDHITMLGDRFNISYVKSPHWTGGILSNIKSIKKSVRKYRNQEESSKKHVLYSGLANLNEVDLLIVLNPQKNFYAINEANRLGIPVIAFVDTHCSLKGIDYPVISNNESVKTVYFLIQLVYWSFFSATERSYLFRKIKKEDEGKVEKKGKYKKKKIRNEETNKNSMDVLFKRKFLAFKSKLFSKISTTKMAVFKKEI